MMANMLFSQMLVLMLLALHLAQTDSGALHGKTNAKCIEAERKALLKFKLDLEAKSTTGTDLLPSWANEEDCSKWLRIQCSNESSHVISLDLSPSTFGGLELLFLSRSGKISPSLVELQYLERLDLSFNNFNSTCVPSFVTTLTNLRYLNLSNSKLRGEIPRGLANLSRLEVLDLSHNYECSVQSLDWVSRLSSLRKLDLTYLSLREANGWFEVVNKKIPYLESLGLGACNLPNIILPSSLSLINSSTSLSHLDLSGNYLSFPLHRWALFNFSRGLIHLDLSYNLLEGHIPEAIGNVASLQYLSLRGNKLGGEISNSFWNLCELRFLYADDNNISGQFPTFTRSPSGCRNYLLQYLYLSRNQIVGSLPDSIGELAQLDSLCVSENFIDGVITEAHFSKLSKLTLLDLSYNPISLNIDSDWTPPFQLKTIRLRSCNLDSSFPNWLRTQMNYIDLDMSSSGLSGHIPSWFWGTISEMCIGVTLSNNQLSGTITNSSSVSLWGLRLDISSNDLEGSVLEFFFNAGVLNLYSNRFSDLDSLCYASNDSYLTFLDLSNNKLSGELPDCWFHLKSLGVLTLSNNRLIGKVPLSIGSLTQIHFLHLGNNQLSGDLPLSLGNCTDLVSLDVGENDLMGSIPSWLGKNVSKLIILSLRSNHFFGSVPSPLCNLGSLNLLDLSQNNLSMNIPKCLGNLTAIRVVNDTDQTSVNQFYAFGSSVTIQMPYEDELQLLWKGKLSEFNHTLRLMKSIDLSSNNLAGEILSQITGLAGLVSLNMSRNELSGKIPSKVGNLKMLDSLDLSNNLLSGSIPQSLSEVDRLNTLDLSNNDLSGEIPTGTQLQSFDVDSYEGNPRLCGAPLPKKCLEPKTTHDSRTRNGDDREDGFVTRGFYFSAGLGMLIGFWGVCGTLIFNRSLRYAYFMFLNDAGDFVYVMVAVHKAKLLRMIRS